jgi:hypothetical protein
MWTRRAVTVFGAGLILAAAGSTAARLLASDPSALVAHEWGTFTSIAGADGRPLTWVPLDARSDLPCFVDRIGKLTSIKSGIPGTVRMETPVVYFYAPRETTVDVGVQFRQGLITEWYPRAAVTPRDIPARGLGDPGLVASARWAQVTIAPGSAESFPREAADSHYYAARDTDAAPIRTASQSEKFLFYRGVGTFTVPLTAIVGDLDRVTVSAVDRTTSIGTVVRFENRGGRIGMTVGKGATATQTFDVPALTMRTGDVAAAIERLLIAEGLFPKEAKAMIETWRGSWFEDGSRLFYIAPRALVDEVLPLDIRPRPAQIGRVFVGRIELLTSATREDITAAVTANDAAALGRYGRFAEPFTKLIYGMGTPEPLASRVQSLRNEVYRRSLAHTVSCAAPGSETTLR